MPLKVAGKDKAEARRLQRLAEQGQLRRIHQGIYTDDSTQPIEAVTRRHLYELCALIVPGSIITHRSAFEQQRPTPAGNYYLTGPYRRDVELPGVKLRITEGPGPLDWDIKAPTLHGDAHISSQARALLENLSVSRGDPRRQAHLGRGLCRTVAGSIHRARCG